MKKLKSKILTLTIIISTLTACTENEKVEKEPNHLLGNWQLEKTDTKLTSNGEIIINHIDFPTQESGSKTEYSFVNDSVLIYYLHTPATGIFGSKDEAGQTTYFKNGNKLTLKLKNIRTYDIKFLDEKNLHLHNYISDTLEGTITTLEVTYKFNKI